MEINSLWNVRCVLEYMSGHCSFSFVANGFFLKSLLAHSNCLLWLLSKIILIMIPGISFIMSFLITSRATECWCPDQSATQLKTSGSFDLPVDNFVAKILFVWIIIAEIEYHSRLKLCSCQGFDVPQKSITSSGSVEDSSIDFRLIIVWALSCEENGYECSPHYLKFDIWSLILN